MSLLHSILSIAIAPQSALRVVQGGASRVPVEEEQLVRLALQGDRQASEDLIRRHMAAILRRTTRLLGPTSEAEDAAQEALYQAIRDLDKLENPKRFGAWLGMIAIHQVHRRFRRRRLRRALGLEKPTEESHLHALVSPSADPSIRAQLAQIDQFLFRAKSEDRLAWMLRHVEGLAMNEIVEQQQSSLATVKRRIQRVQNLLETHLGAEMFGDQDDE